MAVRISYNVHIILLITIVTVFVLHTACTRCIMGKDFYFELYEVDKHYDQAFSNEFIEADEDDWEYQEWSGWDFEASLDEYESVYRQTENPEVKLRAFYRSLLCLSYMEKNNIAAKKLHDFKIPDDVPYKAWFLFLKTKLLENLLDSYLSHGDEFFSDGEDSKATPFKSPQKLREEIDRTYKELWHMRHELVKMDLEDDKYFWDRHDINLEEFPTMFDYVVSNWTDSIMKINYPYKCSGLDKLLGTCGAQKPGRPFGEKYCKETFNKPVNFKDEPILVAAELMEEAGQYEIDARRGAAEQWKVKRLNFMCSAFRFRDEDAAAKKAAKLLVKWYDTFETKAGKAGALFHAASLLQDVGENRLAVSLYTTMLDLTESALADAARERLTMLHEPIFRYGSKRSYMIKPGQYDFLIMTKNIKKVTFKLYSCDPEEGCIHTSSDGEEKYEYDELLKTWDMGIEDWDNFKTRNTVISWPLEPGYYYVEIFPHCPWEKERDLSTEFSMRVHSEESLKEHYELLKKGILYKKKKEKQ